MSEQNLRLEWRSPAGLAENPANWRVHPAEQLSALVGVLAEVGWAGACLYNETTGRLIDGHARRKVALEQGAERVPVLVGRWTPEQEAKILATLDPLSALAKADTDKLDALLAEVKSDNSAVTALLASLATVHSNEVDEHSDETATSGSIPELYQILIDCADEEEQARWLEKLSAEGLKVRSLIS
jgi:ParB-like chromosome segregation protein Spo0J